jgi:hypothetical protein
MDISDFDESDEYAVSNGDVSDAAASEALQAAVAAEIRDAIEFEEQVSKDRVKATQYYRGELFEGDDTEAGRSLHVSTDVRDAVIGMMPPLMRIFMGAERIAEYVPIGPEDVQFAEQATELAHYVFTKQNPGFSVLWDVFKDALLRKTGVVKWWHETDRKISEYAYTQLDEQSVAVLLNEPGVEVTDLQEKQDETGQITFDLRIRKVDESTRYRVAAVPSEEFLVDRRARDLDSASLVAHRQSLTVSDLVAMGYDEQEVREHAGGDEDELEYSLQAQVRNPLLWPQADRRDDASQRVTYVESYIRFDRDGDGIAELLKVCTIGGAYNVVAVEGASEIPFAAFCPDPEPHTFVGQSEADKLMDIQRVKSQLFRDVLDSLSQSIHPRTAVVDGQVNIADVMNVQTGGIVRMRAPGMVQPLTTPFVGQAAFPLIEYLDTLKETRTGMSRASQGLNADALQSSTRAAVAATISAAQGRIELVARIFAETGLKRLFRGMLRMFVQHQDRPMMIRMRGQFVQVDPRVWNADMDVDVNVALSATSNEERIAVLTQISQKQEQILAQMGPTNPMVSLAQYRTTLAKIVELSGFRDASQFFTAVPPDWQPPQQQPQPDPAQILAQVEAEKIKADIAINAAKLEIERDKARAADDRERDRIEADTALRAREIELKYAATVDTAQIKAMMDRDREQQQAMQQQADPGAYQ